MYTKCISKKLFKLNLHIFLCLDFFFHYNLKIDLFNLKNSF